MKRGSPPGILTRANLVRRLCRTTTAKFLLRFEMNGNGWPGSNASGVSSGKMSVLKNRARWPRILSVYSSISRNRMPCRGERRPQPFGPAVRLIPQHRRRPLADRRELFGHRQPVR